MKKVLIVEVDVKDGIDFDPNGWEGSLNVIYESSAKFKVRQPTTGAMDGAFVYPSDDASRVVFRVDGGSRTMPHRH